MTNAPIVSIIVPMYNIEEFIEECITSLIHQDYENIEILLINDGSTDNTEYIAKKYANKDPRIKYFKKENGGLCSARNYGLKQSNGEWIMHVDGDDWIDPQMVSTFLDTAQQTHADIVTGNLKFIYPNYSKVEECSHWSDDKNLSLANFISSKWTTLCGTMQRKAIYNNYNLLSPENVSYCEDFHLMTRLCYYANKVVHLQQAFYCYRQRCTSIMHNMNAKTQNDELWVYSDIIRFFIKNGCYDYFKKTMAWRSLKASQELSLKINKFNEFRNYNPDKKDFIFSCPYINIKLKLNMWCLTHHLSLFSTVFVLLRKSINR